MASRRLLDDRTSRVEVGRPKYENIVVGFQLRPRQMPPSDRGAGVRHRGRILHCLKDLLP